MATFQKDGLWIQGGSGALANVDETTPFVPGQLGRVMSVRSTDGKVPRFYQYVVRYATETNATPSAGLVAYWQDLDDFVITADSATAIGGTTNPIVAGVFLGTAPSAGKYGFIQVGGIATAAVTGTANAGDLLVPSASTFQQLAALTAIDTPAVQVPSVGINLALIETSTNSTNSVHLRVIRNGW